MIHSYLPFFISYYIVGLFSFKEYVFFIVYYSVGLFSFKEFLYFIYCSYSIQCLDID